MQEQHGGSGEFLVWNSGDYQESHQELEMPTMQEEKAKEMEEG